MPSQEDIAITKELVEAGKLLDNNILEHIMVRGNSILTYDILCFKSIIRLLYMQFL